VYQWRQETKDPKDPEDPEDPDDPDDPGNSEDCLPDDVAGAFYTAHKPTSLQRFINLYNT